MVISPLMTMNNPPRNYALGSTDAEHERLIRQAARLAPLTEKFFRDAGIGPGQRVLDLGSGVGDVAMLLARLVGSSGEVVGIERDSRSIARAKARVTEAGLRNVSFTQSDVNHQIESSEPFDAAVGRLILMFVPDPVRVLSSLVRLVRLGGVIAFQEPSWAPTFAISTHLPLWSAAASLMCETFRRSGPIQRSEWPSIGSFRRPDCPRQLCRWSYPSGTMQTSYAGCTTLSAVCGRKFSSSTCPRRSWVTSIRWQRGFKPRLRRRKE
jgi:SAM-dependent methyltransferase